MFARALAAIGDLASIAALKTLSPDFRRQIVAWLAPLEHIVRKLLLAEAAELHQREKARTAPCRAHTGAGVASRSAALGAACAAGAARSKVDPAHPATWNATFSFAAPRDPLAVPESRAPRIRALWGATPPPAPPPLRARRPARPEDAPFRLARRLESLRRVLENPLPHAERLARLLARTVRRFPEIVRRYLFAPARTGGYDKADPRLSIDALRVAWNAPELITDSS
jgi:hypothetical protein